jgi:hypothetical protein
MEKPMRRKRAGERNGMNKNNKLSNFQSPIKNAFERM